MIKLIFPPFWSPAQPYLSNPSLAAYLQNKGYKVEQNDFNLIVFESILNAEFLAKCRDKVPTNNIPFRNRAEFCIQNVENYKSLIRSVEGFKLEKYFRCIAFFSLCFRVIAFAYPKESVNFERYVSKYKWDNSASIQQCIQDIHDGTMTSWLYKLLKDKIAGYVNDADIIGISVVGTNQIIPAFIIATLIKKENPDVKIVMGGSIISRWREKISNNLFFFDHVDYYIYNEGEKPLWLLLKHLDGEISINDVPNISFKTNDGKIITTSTCKPIDINELPTPIFNKEDLKKYFSPEVVLPLLSSRGCFWGKCAFCDHSYVYNQNYRARDISLVIKDIKYYIKEYSAKNINFHDEAMNSRYMSELSEALIENKITIKWSTCARIEARFNIDILKQAKDAGLTNLFFGLESTNSSTLKNMKKGIIIEDSIEILQNSSDAGIWNHIFLISGFPTERLEEFNNTIQTIQKYNEIFHTVGMSFFDLVKFSPIAENPKVYGIDILNTNNDLSLSHEFSVMNCDYKEIKIAYDSITSLLGNEEYQYSKYIFREHWPVFSDRIKDAKRIINDEVFVLGVNNGKYYVVSQKMQVFAIDKLSYIIMHVVTKSSNHNASVNNLSNILGCSKEMANKAINRFAKYAISIGLSTEKIEKVYKKEFN